MLKRLVTLNERLSQDFKDTVQLSQTDFYTLECQTNLFCLREQLKSYKLQEGDRVRVIGGDASGDILSFLWMFKKIEGENTYEIIHARSDLTLNSENQQCALGYGRHNQSFSLQMLRPDVVRIRDADEMFLTLDGILVTGDYAEKQSGQQFFLRKVPPRQVPALMATCFILTPNHESALQRIGVFNPSENDVELCPLSYRMSQRWELIRVDPEKEDPSLRESVDRSQAGRKIRMHIRSLLTEQFLSYNREEKKLLQSSYPEEWRLEYVNEEMEFFAIEHFKLRLYLGRSSSNELELSSNRYEWFIPHSKTVIEMCFRREYRRTI